MSKESAIEKIKKYQTEMCHIPHSVELWECMLHKFFDEILEELEPQKTDVLARIESLEAKLDAHIHQCPACAGTGFMPTMPYPTYCYTCQGRGRIP